ncbi:MAG: hypothetical protein GXP45_05885 [bacterium]|nr:hypothetical protein [bacterium]
MSSTNGEEMVSKYYKKGDNLLMEVEKMKLGADTKMPFDMKSVLVLSDAMYQEVSKDGKNYWFSMPVGTDP